MEDNFYLNLLDWPSKDVLAVGLGNKVLLLDAYSNEEKFIKFKVYTNVISNLIVEQHCSHLPVKAIAWSPHHYALLASGGGTPDCSIRFWITATYSHLS